MDSIKSLQVETLPETFPNRMNAAEIVQDLRNTLNPDNFCVRGSELMQILVGYAELAVEPVGWQALWRVDSKTKPELRDKLHSPTLVEVFRLSAVVYSPTRSLSCMFTRLSIWTMKIWKPQ